MLTERSVKVGRGRVAKEEGARTRILEVAGELFADRGFDAVAVAEIAAGAGISTGLVYYHFKDKQHLYESVVREGLHLLEEVAVQTLGGVGTPVERISSFVSEYMSLASGQRHLMRLLIRGVTDIGGPAPQTVLMRSMLTIDRLQSVISEGIESGEFRDIDPHLAATALFALVNTLVTARALDTPVGQEAHGDTAAQATFMAELFFRGITTDGMDRVSHSRNATQ